jgi:hypothetical protein
MVASGTGTKIVRDRLDQKQIKTTGIPKFYATSFEMAEIAGSYGTWDGAF